VLEFLLLQFAEVDSLSTVIVVLNLLFILMTLFDLFYGTKLPPCCVLAGRDVVSISSGSFSISMVGRIV